MAGLIYQLIENLNNEISVFREILETSKREKEEIVKGDLDLINKSVKKLEELSSRAKRLESSRTELISDVALVLNKNKDTITISEIIESIKNQPEEHNSLSSAVSKINELLIEVKEVNEINKSLISQSLEYINYSVNVLQSTFIDNPVNYTKEDSYPGGQQNKSFFDTKQ